MYQIDMNINTAIELQAERLRAIRADRSSPDGEARRDGAMLTTVLAAAAPVALLLAWVLVAR